MIIQIGFFQHLYHIGCAFQSSFYHQQWIDIWRSEFKQETDSVLFCLLIPDTKAIKILQRFTSMNHVVHNTCTMLGRNIKTRYFWVDIHLAIRKGLIFYHSRSNAIIFQGAFLAYCLPKVVRLKTGEVFMRNPYMSPRPPPKISLRHDHDWTRGKVQLGSTVDQQPEGKVVRQSRGEVQHATFSQLTQPIPEPTCDRSGQLDNTQDMFVVKGGTSRTHEID